jgi:oligopeptide transport system ATP-binding protein
MSTESNVLLRAEHLVKEYPVRTAFGTFKGSACVHAVSDVSLEISRGETLGLVGESGCGKSTLGRMIVRLIEPTSGKVEFEGTDITSLPPKKMDLVHRNIQMIFQDPYASLDPRMRVRDIIAEPLLTHKVCSGRKEVEERVLQLMSMVGIRPELIDRYPHQFSGGQRQRIGIARALALQPKLLVCDEPVSALDVSIQSQILNLLTDLQNRFGLTYLFISHDLSVVHYLSNRVCVMFLGRVCEIGPTKDIYEHPLHPYTQFLINAVPQPDPDKPQKSKNLLTGEIPSAVSVPKGCRFHTRCPFAKEICAEYEPVLKDAGNGRMVACHLPLFEGEEPPKSAQKD